MPLKNKILTFTEKFDFAPSSAGYFGLAKIDRIKSTCAPVMSDHPDAERYNYDLLYHCREVFNKVFNETIKSIFFTHVADATQNISSFINLVEDQLNISAKEKSQFFKTKDYSNVSAIRVSVFWLNCPMKRQLLTLFLRAGRKYSTDKTIKDCIFEEKNYEKCWPAVELFLDGYFGFNEKFLEVLKKNHQRGFVYCFSDKTKESILENKLMFKI